MLAQTKMSPRRQSKINKDGLIDAKYSSGDNNEPLSKSYQFSREENNNEIDGLSKDLQMGCVVDAMKRPPNICVETCVYEEDSEPEDGSNPTEQEQTVDEDAYSDEFEDYRSDGEETVDKIDPKAKSEPDNSQNQPQSSVKISKSHSFMSSKANGSVASKSGTSSNYGSLSIPKTNRINMSFTNDRLREIERHNHILLNKILRTRNVTKSSIPPLAPPNGKRSQPPAAFNRKKQQRQIDYENMILLRRIQRAKSSVSSIRR